MPAIVNDKLWIEATPSARLARALTLLPDGLAVPDRLREMAQPGHGMPEMAKRRILLDPISLPLLAAVAKRRGLSVPALVGRVVEAGGFVPDPCRPDGPLFVEAPTTAWRPLDLAALLTDTPPERAVAGMVAAAARLMHAQSG